MKKRLFAILLSMTLFVLSVVGVGAVDATNEADTFSMVSMNFATGVETESTFELTDSELELIEEVVLSRKAPFDVTAVPTVNTTASDMNSDISTNSIIDNDDRAQVMNTESFPYCAIAYIEMVWMDGIIPIYTRGTAFLIDEDTAVTAAHCIYDAERGGWADSVAVFPAKKGIGFWNDPYGSCYATSGSVPGEWRDAEDSDDNTNPELFYSDWARLELETEMDIPSFLEMSVKSEEEIESSNVKISGYPAGTYDVICAQYEADGMIDFVSTYTMFYDIDTLSGQSGSPIMALTDDGYKVIGIHTGGHEDEYVSSNDEVFNMGVRITDRVYNRILQLPLG